MSNFRPQPQPSSAGQPSNSLMFKGLPLGADSGYILSFINIDRIAKGTDGQPLISFLPFKEGHKYKNAKITFTDIDTAKTLLGQWNQQSPPYSKYKLTVNYWEEKPRTNDNAPAASNTPVAARNAPVAASNTQATASKLPSNIIVIHGLPENITVSDICSFVGAGNIASGNQSVRIFPLKNGYRTARVMLTSMANARNFIKDNDDQPLPGHYHKLKITYDAKKIGPKYDDATVRTVSQTVAAVSKSVFIKGLFANCTEDYLISLIGQQKIAKNNKGRRLVDMFPSNSSAKVTFKTDFDARMFVSQYHQKTFPLHDKNKLTVQFCLEKKEQRAVSKPIVTGERNTDKAKTIIRNVVYIQGIDKAYDEARLTAIVDRRTRRKISKLEIFRYADGKSQGRGIITYKNAADAQHCILVLNGQKLDEMGKSSTSLKLNLFESSNVRRVEGAIGNEHLFGPNTKGYAYDCLGCFETWDERDMLGCVPLSQQTDTETHFMCQDCVRRSCESNKVDGRLADHGTGLPCGQVDCKRVLLWAPVNRILTNRDTAALLDKRTTEEALRPLEDIIEYCKENCGYGATIDTDPRIMQFFTCLHPTCGAQFCRLCKVSSMEHAGKSCNEVDPQRLQEQEARRQTDEINERLCRTMMLVCPECSTRFIKSDGCNFMTCRCGFKMCYVCKEGGVTQSHFGNGRCDQFESTSNVDSRNYNEEVNTINADSNMRPLLANFAAFGLSSSRR